MDSECTPKRLNHNLDLFVWTKQIYLLFSCSANWRHSPENIPQNLWKFQRAKRRSCISEDKFLPVVGQQKARLMGSGKLMAPFETETMVFWLKYRKKQLQLNQKSYLFFILKVPLFQQELMTWTSLKWSFHLKSLL